MNLVPEIPPTTPATPLPPIALAWKFAPLVVALLILVSGIFVRVYLAPGFKGVGFDEGLYRDYVIKIDRVGLENFPAICQLYLEDQRNPETITKLPPTRFLYIVAGWMWKRVQFGDAPPVPPNTVAPRERPVSRWAQPCFQSRLDPPPRGRRTRGVADDRAEPGLGVLALMAFAPTQIHMSQHALIDGFFALFAHALPLDALGKSAASKRPALARCPRRLPRADGAHERERVLRLRGALRTLIVESLGALRHRHAAAFLRRFSRSAGGRRDPRFARRRRSARSSKSIDCSWQSADAAPTPSKPATARGIAISSI